MNLRISFRNNRHTLIIYQNILSVHLEDQQKSRRKLMQVAKKDRYKGALKPISKEEILKCEEHGRITNIPTYKRLSPTETEIRLGQMSGVNVSLYAHGPFNAAQMREIRLTLESGLDPQSLGMIDPCKKAKEMAKLRKQAVPALGQSKNPPIPKNSKKGHLMAMQYKRSNESTKPSHEKAWENAKARLSELPEEPKQQKHSPVRWTRASVTNETHGEVLARDIQRAADRRG